MADADFWNRVLLIDFDGAAGAELVTNGGFDADTDWTKGTGWTIAAGVATKSGGTLTSVSQSIAGLTAGAAYLVSYTISGRTAGFAHVELGGTTDVMTNSTNAVFTEVVIAEATDTVLHVYGTASFDGDIDDVSVKLLPTAATDASRFAHSLTFNGAAALDPSQKEYGTASLFLDGVDSYVSIEAADFGQELLPYRDSHAFEIEVRPVDIGADFIIAAQWDSGTNDRVWLLWWDDTTGRVTLSFSNNGVSVTDTAYYDVATDTVVNIFDGNFHHITFYRVISGEVYVAVDGNVGAADTGAAVEFYDIQTAVPITIGCRLGTGVGAVFMEGHVDAVRFTLGIEEYNATTGSFTEPSAAHDTVDGGEGAAYSYPLSVNMFNPTAATSSTYPWVRESSSTDWGMAAVLDSAGGPTPRTISDYCFNYGGINFAQNSANATYGISYLDVDMSRYDSQFLDDIDAGILEIDFSGWAYLELAGDGHGMIEVEFRTAGGTILGAKPSDFFIPSVAATWEQTSVVARIPPSTRIIRFRVRTSKNTNSFVDQRYFWCDFTADIDQITDFATVSNSDTYYADVDDMVASWNSGNTTMVKQDVRSTTTRYIGHYAYDNTALGTDVECDSGIINLLSNTTDIDAGSVDYELTVMMANDADACSVWVEFYEADGTTIVGTRTASTKVTRNSRGEVVTLTGTIPATAEKALIGFVTDNGASGADMHANNVTLMEIGPNPDGSQSATVGGFHIIRRRRRYRAANAS